MTLLERAGVEKLLTVVNDDLPFPWNVKLQANGMFAVFYGYGARRDGFRTPEAAADWAQKNA